MLKDKMAMKQARKVRLRRRMRERVRGTLERPRVHVFKSNRHVFTQAIDDSGIMVLAAASTMEKEIKERTKSLKNKAACELLGELMARKLKDKKIDKIVFDRGIYPYHGRIKALAEAMRKSGITF